MASWLPSTSTAASRSGSPAAHLARNLSRALDAIVKQSSSPLSAALFINPAASAARQYVDNLFGYGSRSALCRTASRSRPAD
ncbi:hypothetical protein BDW72DRAFT_187633 [Aspergillus terricola var. indicus]